MLTFLTIGVTLLMASVAPLPARADLVLKNGRIWTVDAAKPEAQAVAILGDRIVFVGTDTNVQTWIGPTTKVLDLQGRRVVPGFYDSHVHVLSAGRLLSQVNLKDARDEAEFGRRLKNFHDKLPRDRWMLGGNWDHDGTFQGKLPTAALIDRYAPDRPVFLRRYDGHMGVANTRALKIAGITAETKDPDGGVIFRGADGKTPTGVLKDNAMDLVSKHIPAPDFDEIAEAVRAALAEARRLGVTSMQDMDGSDAGTRRKLFRIFQRLAARGEMTARIDLRWPIAQAKELEDLGIEANFGNLWIRVGGVKGFMDGSLGSSTALMFDAYDSEATTKGVYVTPRGELLRQILIADRAGLSVAIHAIGDRANAELLDMFAEVAKQHGPRDRRFRIEHAQHLRVADYPLFKERNIIASMQPYHIIDDGRWAEGRIGKKRCSSSYANRSLLDAGAILAFGSDWPVAPLEPLLGIDAAVNRRTLDGKHPNGWFPEQKITVAEAIYAYTMGSAYAAFQERERGSISMGKLADLVVLSVDILDPNEKDRITTAEIHLTIAGGKIVYEANATRK